MKKIFLRHAIQEDAEFLFELTNDKECRRNSLNSQKITFEEHMDWFHEILCSKVQRQYILMEGDRAVGQGRLENKEGCCRISYSIIPERRGCGYGKHLLQLLKKAAIREFPKCGSCYGEVLKENIASQKIFEELNYSRKEQDNYIYYSKINSE